MICHLVNIMKAAIEVMNPGQIPILTCDQALYTSRTNPVQLADMLFGEDHIVVMISCLHIVMSSLKILGGFFWKPAAGQQHSFRLVFQQVEQRIIFGKYRI